MTYLTFQTFGDMLLIEKVVGKSYIVIISTKYSGAGTRWDLMKAELICLPIFKYLATLSPGAVSETTAFSHVLELSAELSSPHKAQQR